MTTRKKETTDVVIVGAGPAGLFAIFECGMLKMKCHVVEGLPHVGGQCTALYPEKPIYDIPGFPRIAAGELITKLEEQAKPFNAVYHLSQQVTGLIRQQGGRLLLTTSGGTDIDCAAVIIAAGAGAFGPNRPPLDNIRAFEGKSVFYSVRQRDRLAGKKIAIAGGGDSAVDWALSLAPIAEKIYFIHRRDKFRAAPESVAQLEALAAKGRVDMVIPFQLHALEGDNGILSGITLADLDGNTKRIEADILLPFFGLTPDLALMADWGLGIDQHKIPVDPASMQTSEKGVFAIGDVAGYAGKLKLILTGFSEAAVAAHNAHPLVFPGQALHFVYSTTKGVS